MNILLTGGTGFIGANLVRSLLKDRHSVSLITRNSSNYTRIEDIKFKCNIIETDITDYERLRASVINKTKGIDALIHLAAYGVTEKNFDIDLGIKVNLIGTSHLLQLSKELCIPKFINTGSCFEYAESKKPYTETNFIEPKTLYGAIKASQTILVSSFALANNLNVTTLRLFTPYGPYEDPDRFIPYLLSHAMNKKQTHLGNPCSTRDFVFIDDVIDAYKKALKYNQQENPGIFNIGSEKQYSLKEIVEIVQKILNINLDSLVVWNDKKDLRSVDFQYWASSCRKAKKKLGWTPTTSIEEGLKKIIKCQN